MIFERIFLRKPKRWGLRGDAFLWDALGWDLSQIWKTKQPASTNEFMALVNERICYLTDSDFPRNGRDLKLNWLPEGGMSGGAICAETWRSDLLPELRNRAKRAFNKDLTQMGYHPAEHRFRYAAWCAATAARSSRRTCSFSVQEGSNLLRICSVKYLALGPHWLPLNQHFDDVHEKWRTELQRHAQTLRIEGFSHGIAAKLINCFLKTLFLGQMTGPQFDPYEHPQEEDSYSHRMQSIHPPIDRLLLKQLTKENVGGHKREWSELHKTGWSKFNSGDYQRAIDLIRTVTSDRLWMIETYWPGYVSASPSR